MPPRLLLAISIAGIAGHNLLDAYEPDGVLGWLFRLAHVPGLLAQAGGRQMFLAYPVILWVFVMALGFAIAPVFRWEAARRQRALLVSGGALLAAFVVLRGIELYGDPLGWSVQRQLSRSVMSFLNCEKYPPSLCFLLMTLGPALIALALLERGRGRIADVFAVYVRAGVARPPKPIHCLRHTFGTMMARRVPLGVLQKLLGHSDVQTTMRYVDVDEGDKRDAIAAVFGSAVAASWQQTSRQRAMNP